MLAMHRTRFNSDLAGSEQRHRPQHTMGIAYWQLNSEWPGASKSGLERYGRWKLLHHAMVDSYADQLVTTAVVGNSLVTTFINDLDQALETGVALQ